MANINFSKTQLSKIVEQEGLLADNPFQITSPLSPFKMFNSVANSYIKELQNTDAKKVNNDILADTGLNIIGKKD